MLREVPPKNVSIASTGTVGAVGVVVVATVVLSSVLWRFEGGVGGVITVLVVMAAFAWREVAISSRRNFANSVASCEW
jgi:hypothetical protein